MAVVNNKLLIILVLSYILNCCSAKSEETPILRYDEIEQIAKDVLNTTPDFIHVIAQLEKTDFLEQYKSAESNEDKYLDVFQLTAKYGFQLQTYPVQTEDGYKITVYRIPGKGDPVLLVHGLCTSAVDWFTIGRDNALPYLLSEQGYDVWLLNCRGSTPDSRGHVSLSAEENPSEYWDFSWDEIGRYDLPATIDQMLNITGKPTIKYVGYSEGNTDYFVMAAERPEYNDKISLSVSLGPVTWMSHIVSPLVRIIALFNDASGVIRNVIGFNVLKENNPLVQLVTKQLCGNTELATLLCSNILFGLSGFDYNQINITQMPVIFKHLPSDCSTKRFFHFAQTVRSGKFRQYDYGSIGNFAKYGSVEPPEYHVEKITTPVAIFYREDSDWLSAYEDVMILKNKLPNVVDFYEVPNDEWCHTDYFWAKDVKHLVHNRILELFKKY